MKINMKVGHVPRDQSRDSRLDISLRELALASKASSVVSPGE